LGASGTGNIAAFAGTNSTASPISGTITVTPHYLNNGVTCDGTTTSFIITVNPTPTVTKPSDQTVCKGSNTTLVTFSGTGTSYTWANDNTAIGLGASGTGNIAAFAGTNSTASPISGTITVTPHYLNNGVTCDGTTTSFIITVNPLPTASISGTASVCKDATAPNVTFTGAGGTAPYTFTYKINSGSNLTVSTIIGNSVTVAAPTGTDGSFVYSLLSVQETSSTACSQVQSDTATITVNPLPVLVIANPSPPCTPGTADLTAAAVTAGSTLPAGTILSYWTTQAATTAVSNPTAVGVGTYWVKATTSANCIDIKSVTIAVNNCRGHIYATATTCNDFLNDVNTLDKICYTVATTTKGRKTINTISNATPGVFFYYAKIIAPNDLPVGGISLSVNVIQFNTSNSVTNSASLPNFLIQQGQVFVFDGSCNKIATGTVDKANPGNTIINLPNVKPGQVLVVSVKYDVKTLVGQLVNDPVGPNYQAYFISKATYGGSTSAIVYSNPGNINVYNCSAPTAPLAVATTTAKVAPIEATGFDAYPVPFKDQLTIKYKFDYKSDVKIDVFNAQGMSVLSKTDTDSYLDKEVTLDLKASKRQEQVYVVKVTTNQGTFTKKVMSSK
jgi:hypothetical protein